MGCKWFGLSAWLHSVLELDFKKSIGLVVPLMVFVVMAPLWCLLANALLILATGQLSKRAGKKAEAVSGRNQFHPHSLSPSIGLAFPSAKNGDENLARAKVVHAKL